MPAITKARGLAKIPTATGRAASTGPAAGHQHQAAHGQRQAEDERVLPVGQVEGHHPHEQPGRPDIVDLPHVSLVQIEQGRQCPGGEHRDHLGRHEQGEHVEHEPVVDGAVAAAVPVVVPEDRLAVTEQVDLVDVGGIVPPGNAAVPHEQRHHRRGNRGHQPEEDHAARRLEARLDAGPRHSCSSAAAALPRSKRSRYRPGAGASNTVKPCLSLLRVESARCLDDRYPLAVRAVATPRPDVGRQLARRSSTASRSA